MRKKRRRGRKTRWSRKNRRGRKRGRVKKGGVEEDDMKEKEKEKDIDDDNDHDVYDVHSMKSRTIPLFNNYQITTIITNHRPIIRI